MKISFVYDAAYPWVKGGVEKRIYEFAKRLSERGHDVKIYTLKWWDGPDFITYNGINYYSLGGKKGLYNKGRRSFIEAVYFGIRAFRIRIERDEIVEAQSFPYFHLFSLKMITLRGKGQLIITWHEVWKGYWKDYFNGKIYFGILGIIIEKLATRLTKFNLSNSFTTSNLLSSIRRGNNEIIPSGIDMKKFGEIEHSYTEYDIITISRFIREKRIDELVKAVNLLRNRRPNIRVILVGDGPEYYNVLKLIGELDLTRNITLAGFLSDHASVISIIKASKVFVSASTREGFFLSLLEAMACGVPSVVTSNKMNAGKELVTSEPITGWIYNSGSENLANTMDEALTKYLDLKENCVQKAKNFDWEILTDRLLSYYEKILSQKNLKS